MENSSRRSLVLAAAAVVVVVVLAAGVALVVATGDSDDDGTAGETTTSAPAPTTTTAAPVPAEPTCAEGDLDTRRYILCTAGDTPDQPLVVALHGRGSSAAEMQAGTELHQVAAAQGLAVVYADGLSRAWGDDTFPTPTRPAGDEDVVFLDDLVAALQADPRIGDGPVGVVGHSNGASMALRYAAQRPDAVRAVVAVAGQLPRDPAVQPTASVPVLVIYGTADPVRSYDAGIAETPGRQPGQPTPTLPTPDTVAAFVSVTGTTTEVVHDGPTETDPEPTDGTTVRTESWTSGDTTVTLQAIVGGGHTWPSARGTAPRADFGVVSRDLDASSVAIEFVAAEPR